VDDYVSGPAPASLAGDPSFTVAFWMKYTLTPTRAWIMTLGNGAPNQGLHWLIGPDGVANFGVWGPAPGQPQNYFSISSYQGQWVHVATTYTASTRILKTYLNGVEVDSDVGSNPLELQLGGGLSLGKRWADENQL
jgi:hypothetical protein